MRLLRETCVTFGLLAIAAASNVSAQNAPACQSIEFGPRVLERAPKIREACLDVITRGDQHFAVIKAELLGVTPSSIRVRFKRPDGSFVESRTIPVTPEFRVLIDGKPTRIEDVLIGQELTTYVKVSEPVITLDPDADGQPLEPASPTREPRVIEPDLQPVLPHTASMLPHLAVQGLVLVLVAWVLILDWRLHSKK